MQEWGVAGGASVGYHTHGPKQINLMLLRNNWF